MAKRENVKYRCMICQREGIDSVLVGRKGMLEHQRRMHAGAEMECEPTRDRATSKNRIPKPLRGDPAKKCKLCGQIMASQSAVGRHFKTKHPGKTPAGNTIPMHVERELLMLCQQMVLDHKRKKKIWHWIEKIEKHLKAY